MTERKRQTGNPKEDNLTLAIAWFDFRLSFLTKDQQIIQQELSSLTVKNFQAYGELTPERQLALRRQILHERMTQLIEQIASLKTMQIGVSHGAIVPNGFAARELQRREAEQPQALTREEEVIKAMLGPGHYEDRFGIFAQVASIYQTSQSIPMVWKTSSKGQNGWQMRTIAPNEIGFYLQYRRKDTPPYQALITIDQVAIKQSNNSQFFIAMEDLHGLRYEGNEYQGTGVIMHLTSQQITPNNPEIEGSTGLLEARPNTIFKDFSTMSSDFQHEITPTNFMRFQDMLASLAQDVNQWAQGA